MRPDNSSRCLTASVSRDKQNTSVIEVWRVDVLQRLHVRLRIAAAGTAGPVADTTGARRRTSAGRIAAAARGTGARASGNRMATALNFNVVIRSSPDHATASLVDVEG